MIWRRASKHHLESDPYGYTIAKVIVPLEGRDTLMYEVWDVRREPAKHLGVWPTADAAKARAEL